MKRWGILAIVIIIISIVTGVSFWQTRQRYGPISPLGNILPRPLEKYAIVALSRRLPQNGSIVLDAPIATTSAYTSYEFHFATEGKKVTGLANIPKGTGPFPVIVQFRGYIDREQYHTGDGTRNSGHVYAQNGYVALAPDFLGYGGSDNPSDDVFEERFQTYTTVLDLIAAVQSFSSVDASRMGFWAHSNGGQIALTVLEILQKPIPTVLWAPVTRRFPYSILFFTDEASDGGKLLRKELARFEETYDADAFALTNYLDRLRAPIQLHQGTADTEVPLKWSNEFVEVLKKLHIDTTYYVYPGADHNMLGAWNTVVARDLEFFSKQLSF